MMSVFKYILFGTVLCVSLQSQAQLFKKGKDADDLYNEAVQETKQQHYQKAIELSKQALAKRSDFIDQELLLGRLYMLTGNYELARKYVKTVLAKKPFIQGCHIYMPSILRSVINVMKRPNVMWMKRCTILQVDKDLMLKKLAVLDVAQNFYQGGVYANALLEKYSGDTTVQKRIPAIIC